MTSDETDRLLLPLLLLEFELDMEEEEEWEWKTEGRKLRRGFFEEDVEDEEERCWGGGPGRMATGAGTVAPTAVAEPPLLAPWLSMSRVQHSKDSSTLPRRPQSKNSPFASR